MDESITDTKARYTCWSLDEFADQAAKRASRAIDADVFGRRSFQGNVNLDDAVKLAKDGWSEDLDETLRIAEEAVSMCERDHVSMRPEMTYDVAGDYVDMGRYLSGEPECMVDYPLQPVSIAGKVITLCASTSHWSRASTDEIMQRGRSIAALAIALTRLGHSLEIWADYSSEGYGSTMSHIRILIKGADDAIDPERIMYAFAHPSMQRVLGFGFRHGLPERHRKDQGVGLGYGHPASPERDLPEGAIYVDREDWNDDPATEVERQLRKLGLIES